MGLPLKAFAAPIPYRLASISMLLAAVGLPSAVAFLDGPDWLGFLTFAPIYILLAVLTYHRLRDAALSGGWIGLMIIAFNVGPSWDGPGPLMFYVGNTLHAIPIILGWIVPSNFGANPEVA